MSKPRLEVVLRKGMTHEQVRQVLGTPADIRPVNTPEGEAETWVYRRIVDRIVEQQATSTQDIPYVDPITGQTRMIPEPVYSMVTIIVTEEANLFWFEGVLVSWKTQYLRDRSFNQ